MFHEEHWLNHHKRHPDQTIDHLSHGCASRQTTTKVTVILQQCQRRLPVSLSILSNERTLHKSAIHWVASTNWNEEKKSGRPNPTTWKDPTCSIVCNERPAMWCINYKTRDHSRWLHDRHNCERTKVSVDSGRFKAWVKSFSYAWHIREWSLPPQPSTKFQCDQSKCNPIIWL